MEHGKSEPRAGAAESGEEEVKSFAVVPHPMKRREAVSPRSASWTLYELQAELRKLDGEQRRRRERLSRVQEQLVNVRNLLRLPREELERPANELAHKSAHTFHKGKKINSLP
jgi:hypothetical protein